MKTLTENIRPILAILTVVFTFAYFMVAAFIRESRDPQITIAVVAVNSIVFAYFFSSSQGSANKQNTLDSIIKK